MYYVCIIEDVWMYIYLFTNYAAFPKFVSIM